MKRNQLIVMLVGIAVFILMGLFPLKEGYTTGGGRSGRPRGYQEPYYDFFISGSIRWDALIIQWAIVVVITGGLIYTLGVYPQLPQRIRKWFASTETPKHS